MVWALVSSNKMVSERERPRPEIAMVAPIGPRETSRELV